jgi:hypothetical protein
MTVDTPRDGAPTFGAGHQPKPSSARRRGGQGGNGAICTLIGGVSMVLAAFLPWATSTDGEIVPGTNTADGPLMLILGVILAGVGIGRLSSKMAPWAQHLPVLLAGFGAWASWHDVAMTTSNFASGRYSTAYSTGYGIAYNTPSVGIGLYVVAVGASVAVLGCMSVTTEVDK